MQHTFTPVRTWPCWLLIGFVSLWVVTSAVAQTSAFTSAQIEEGAGCNWPFSALATNPKDGKIYAFWRKGASEEATYKLIRFDGNSWAAMSSFSPSGGSAPIKVPNFDGAQDYTGLAIDALGRYHVVFSGYRGSGIPSTRGVWYGLSTDGVSWAFTEIQTFSDPNGWKNTSIPDIALDKNNQPHIAFLFSDANDPRTYTIRYYRYTGSAWTTGENAFSQSGGSPASNEINNFDLAVDGNAKAHLAIQRETGGLGRNGGLVYTTNSSGNWAAPTVLAEGAQDQTQGTSLGIDVDAANKVHIVYSGYPGQIKYTTNVSGSFSPSQQINSDLSGSIVRHSFSINGNGVKSFAYGSSGLRFAYQPVNSSSWITTLAYSAPSGSSAASFPSGTLSPSGRIMVLFDYVTGSCTDNNARKLWYATATVSSSTPTIVTPTVTTNSASDVTGASATLGGNVTADGGASITGRGIVYSSSNTTPAVGGSGVTQDANGSVTGQFSKTIAGLTSGTTYYVRAYATNSAGTSYGSVVTFITTPNAPVVVTPANGVLLNSATPTYSGTVQGNATVIVYVDGASIGTTTATGSGNFSLTQPTALAQGSHTVRATATIGSSAASVSSNTNDFTVDTVAPSIGSVSAPANGTYGAGRALSFTVNFSETVTVTGTPQLGLTIGSTTRQASYASGSGTQALTFTYTVPVGDLDADGIGLASALSLNGGSIRDAAVNNATLTLNGVASTTGVLVDGVAPTVSSVVRQSPAGTTITNATALTFRVSLSENVTGVTINAFTLTNIGAISGSVGSVAAVNGSGSQFDVTVNNVSGDGALRLDVKNSGSGVGDLAGNALSGGFTSGESFTVDQTSPVVVISSSAGAPGGSTRNSPIPFSVTFSESVTGFVAGDITVTNGTLSPVTGSGPSYNFTVTPLANGTVTVRIPANVAQDMASNGNTAASSFSIDYLPLTLTGFAALSPSVCTGSPLSFTATVSNADGPYAYTLTNGPSSVTGTATGTAFSRTITAAGSGPQSFTLVVADASQTVRASQAVTVNPLPVVSINNLASAYCQDAPVVTLMGSPAGIGGSFTIDGINASVINPMSLTVGQHTVAFRFTDNNGCSNATSQNVTIKETPLAPSLLTQSGQSYPSSQSAVTVDLNTGTVTLVASGCAGTVNWTGPNNTAGMGTTIPVSTTQPGLFTYQANCTINGCTGPLATAMVRVGGRLTVLHRDVDNYADNNAIQPLIQIQNQGAGSLPLSRLTLRYYVTVENAATLGNLSMNYAQVGNQNVRLRYVALNPVQQGAQGYVEYSFTDGAGSLGAGANSGPIQSYFTKSDYGSLNELDDYSYNPVRNQLTGNLRITAYYDGVLISGQEPGAPFAPIRAVRALTESKNGPSATQINTFLEVRNEGNVAINYSDLNVRYYFTADGNERLQVEVDEGNVSSQLVKLNTPLAGADTYLELRFNQGGQLAPGASTGTIRYRISKPDGGRFNQANDYSYQEQPQDRSQNSRVVVYAGQDRVWGQEPGSTSRTAFAESVSAFAVTVLGNPVRDDQVVFEVSSANGQPLQLRLLTPQGRVVNQQQMTGSQATEQYRLSLGSQAGNVLLLQVSTPTQSQTVKVIRAD